MAAFLQLILDFLVKWFNRPPTVEAEVERAGAAEAKVKEQNDAIAVAQGASDAGAAVERDLADPTRLRELEARDPNNRANSS